MPTHPIRFGIQTGQQLVGWNELKELWHSADDWGYDSLWTFDHFYPIFVPDTTGPCMEGWTTLTALSQQTKRARIGAMVNGNTYRNPCITAKMAATLDHVSDGRLNLGLGAGWFELEHRSFGIDFKTIPERLRALDESLRIIKGMFENEKTTLHGRHYKVTDAVCSPKPLQKPHPPIMIGGQGQQVLLKIVARHADMWNVPNASAERYTELTKVIERHGDTVGRDTDQIEKTIMMGFCYRAPADRERVAIGRFTAVTGASEEQARRQMMIGSRDECLDTIDRYRKAGVTHFIFTLPRPFYLDEVQAFAEEVIPEVRSR
jgi:F420-dependent oxidoreductase-like protein